MVHPGYFALGGREFINADRAAAYAAARTPSLHVTDAHSCSDLRYDVNRKPLWFDEVATRRNLAINPALGADTVGWTSTPGSSGTVTTTRETTNRPLVDGVPRNFYRMKWTSINVGTVTDVGPIYGLSSANQIMLEPGKSYIMTAYARSNVANRSARATMSLYRPSDNTFVQSYGGATVPVGGTNLVRLSVIVPPQTELLRGSARVRGVGGALWQVNDTFDMTCVLVEEGTTIQPYFDGDSRATFVPDQPYGYTYQWEGNYSASVSRLVKTNQPNGESTPNITEIETLYTTPERDKPLWYSPNTPDSADFLGVYPVSITGIDDDTTTAEVVEGVFDGGAVGRPRKQTREIRFSALLMAATPRGLDYGLSWLRNVLTPVTACDGETLSFYSACPGTVPLSGYQPDLPTHRLNLVGDYGWSPVGGTFTPNHTTHVGVYDAAAVGDYVKFSPVSGVPGPMKFTVDIDRNAMIAAAARKNWLKNPSNRESYDVVTLRRNLCTNPTGRRNANGWTPFSSGGVSATNVGTRGANPSDTQRPSVNGYRSNNYIRVLATKAGVAKANSGVYFRANLEIPGGVVSIRYIAQSRNTEQLRTRVRYFAGFNGTGTELGTAYVGPTNTSAGSWKEFWTNVVPPSGTNSVIVYAEVPSGVSGTYSKNTSVVDVAEVLIEHANSRDFRGIRSGYFDGSLLPNNSANTTGLGVQWEGDPDASISVLTGAGLINTLMPIATNGTVGYRAYNATARFILSRASESLDFARTDAISTAGATRNGWSARFRLSSLESSGSGFFIAKIVAYNSSGGVIGTVGTSSTYNVPLNGTTNVVVPASTSAAGAASIRLQATWISSDLTSSLAVSTLLEIDDIIIENVDVGATAGSYFDGNTKDAVNTYRWLGVEDYSESVAIPLTSTANVPLTLQAVDPQGDVLAASSGAVVDDTLTLEFTGIDDVIEFRIIPGNDSPFGIEEASLEWALPVGYVDPLAGYTWFPNGIYGDDGNIPGSGGSEAVIPRIIDSRIGPYRRTMRRVSRVSGPTVIERYPQNGSACLMRVEFIMVAAVPHAYGDEVPQPYSTLNIATARNEEFVLSQAIPLCLPVGDVIPVQDPNCPAPVVPPRAPQSPLLCDSVTGAVVRRYGQIIPADQTPSASDVSVIARYYPDSDGQPLNVLFYPLDSEDQDLSTIDPCSLEGSIQITFAPRDGIIVNGASERAYSIAPEVVQDGDGDTYASGREVERPADHLIRAVDGTPFEWPLLRGGKPYLVVMETYDETRASLGISLVPRR